MSGSVLLTRALIDRLLAFKGFVLTPFFTYYAMTKELIGRMADEIEAVAGPNGFATPPERQ